jgi:hypothetical protein
MVSKTQKLMLISNQLQSCKKINEKRLLAKNYCVQKLSDYNFFWTIFFAYFRIRTQHRILRFMIPVSNFCANLFLLILALLLTFKPNAD